jgi:hypothetical protein
MIEPDALVATPVVATLVAPVVVPLELTPMAIAIGLRHINGHRRADRSAGDGRRNFVLPCHATNLRRQVATGLRGCKLTTRSRGLNAARVCRAPSLDIRHATINRYLGDDLERRRAVRPHSQVQARATLHVEQNRSDIGGNIDRAEVPGAVGVATERQDNDVRHARDYRHGYSLRMERNAHQMRIAVNQAPMELQKKKPAQKGGLTNE